MFTPSKNPITFGMMPAQYHAIGEGIDRGKREFVMSQSELRKFSRCPRKWLFGQPPKTSAAMEWGSVLDILLLTPERAEALIVAHPEKYIATDKKEKAWTEKSITCKAWVAEREKEGKIVVSPEYMSEAWRAVRRLQAEADITDILSASKTQVCLRVEYHDEETGIVVPMKCLLDILPNEESDYGDSVFDFKTTNSAESRKWTRHVYDFGLYYQAACYLEAVNAATGLKYRNFGHIISESYAPYEPTVRLLSQDFLTLGRSDLESDLRHYCRCLKKGWFPGFDRAEVEPLAWMLNA